MLQKCSNKQSTTSMESEVFEKKLKKKPKRRTSGNFTHPNTNITSYTEDAYQIYSWCTMKSK